MTAVTASEASQQFSKLLELAEAGEEVVITKRGRTVAKLVPAVDDAAVAKLDLARKAAAAFFTKGISTGVVVDWTRDEIYDRDDRSDVE
jgi:prevent-host-death family protein